MAAHAGRLVRARIAASMAFLLFGLALGAWTSRIPAIKERLGLSDGWLSVALLAFAAGCIAGMALIGRLTDRFGSRRMLIAAALLEGVLLVPPAIAPSLASLAVALFVFGVVHGTLNIAMNANGIEVERAWRGRILSSLHASYSLGGVLGAVAGSLFARAGASAGTTLVSVGAVVLVLAAWASWWALPAAPVARESSQRAPGAAGDRPYYVLLGVIVLCTLVGEGAAADWSAVYLRDDLGSTASFAPYAYAAFALAMTAGRLFGDRLATALGPAGLVRTGAATAAVGLGAALLLDQPYAGVVGFGLLGAGLSGIAPQVFSAAGNHDPARAGRALSTVVSIGYLGFVLGPILIGAAATVVKLPAALAIPVLLALFVAIAARALNARRAPAASLPTEDLVA
jgi:MFS family permease